VPASVPARPSHRSPAYVVYLIMGAQQHDALEEYSAVMLSFVLPITIVTLVAMVIRDQQSRSDG
jgi:Mn2+/Fe2+ NRAMP family transporter